MTMKITVVGMGYVGLSNAILLSQKHDVIAVDVMPERVEMVNNRKCPIHDVDMIKFLRDRDLNLTATLNLTEAVNLSLIHI